MGIIARQGLIGTIFNYIGVLIGFVSIIFIQPNFLSSSEIGLTKILVSFSFLTSIFVPLGINSITMRFFPKIKNERNNHNGHFWIILIFNLIGCILLDFFLFYYKDTIKSFYLEKSKLFNDYYHLLYFFPAIISLIGCINVYLASLFKTSFFVFLNEIFNRLAQISIILIYYNNLINLDEFLLAFTSVYFIQLVLLIIYSNIINKITFKIDWSFYKTFFNSKVIIYALLMILTSFSSIGIRMLDQLIMGHYLSLSSVGIYTTSIFIAIALDVPLNSIERISIPVIAESWEKNDLKNIKKIYCDSVRILMLIGGFLFCGLIICSDSLFQILPEEYSVGKHCMMIICLSSFVNLTTGVNNAIIATSHKYFILTIFLIILIAISLISNIVLIPKYGIIGAAYSTFFSMSIYNILKMSYIWYRLKMLPYDKISLVILITIIITLGSLYFTPNFNNPYLNILFKGTLITMIFTFITIKFKIAPQIISKIPYLKKLNF